MAIFYYHKWGFCFSVGTSSLFPLHTEGTFIKTIFHFESLAEEVLRCLLQVQNTVIPSLVPLRLQCDC